MVPLSLWRCIWLIKHLFQSNDVFFLGGGCILVVRGAANREVPHGHDRSWVYCRIWVCLKIGHRKKKMVAMLGISRCSWIDAKTGLSETRVASKIRWFFTKISYEFYPNTRIDMPQVAIVHGEITKKNHSYHIYSIPIDPLINSPMKSL